MSIKLKHTCIATVVGANNQSRKITVVMTDGDQYTEDFAMRVPLKYPMPVPVEDGDFWDRYGQLPLAENRCHVKIGYDYAYNVKRHYGKFKLRNPVYLGEVKAKSCSSMNGLKREVKVHG